MPEVSFTGGSLIGWVNASWPLAKLSSSSTYLKLVSLGTYEFTPQQVVSLENYWSIPFFANGIRINHNRADYPAKMIFWCIGSRSKVFSRIKESGFSPAGQPIVRPSGFPIRWPVVIGIVAVWNLLFLADGSFTFPRTNMPGKYSVLALLLVFGLSSAVRVSKRFQLLVLRPGHDVGEIASFLMLLQIVTGLLICILGAMLVFNG